MSDNSAFRELCRVIDEHRNLKNHIKYIMKSYTYILENALHPTKFNNVLYQILPSEIWSLIMSSLEMNDRMAIARTCRHVYNSLITKDEIEEICGQYSYGGITFDGRYWELDNMGLRFRYLSDLERPSKALFNRTMLSINEDIYFRKKELVLSRAVEICAHCYKIKHIKSRRIGGSGMAIFRKCEVCNPRGREDPDQFSKIGDLLDGAREIFKPLL